MNPHDRMTKLIVMAVAAIERGEKVVADVDVAEALRAELAKPAPAGYEEQHEQDQREIATLRAALATARQREQGDTWLWAGDGSDNLHSMGNGMTVVIRASELRRLIAEGAKPAPVAVLSVEWSILSEFADRKRCNFGDLCAAVKAAISAGAEVDAMLSAPQPPAPAVDVEAVRDGELNEIADGAWGDGPAVRGAARDRLARTLGDET